ncbi:MAG: 16S rRNA (guanine(966)-N(2))-methyltransferase RsmD [Acetobacteraceae bacterium]|nr:16S rRNA (guanine(966)-N(2))-methyltransferase RsmD [Acetobacteraceae bacterium]
MRIVGGDWRGRRLVAPPGQATRPTADRVRQALFDTLLHAPWGGRATIEGATVLDAFAGTGALGLEALSRGAEHATFVERDRAARAALGTNIAHCRAAERSTVLAENVLRIGVGMPFTLLFFDPPYGLDLVAPAVTRLRAMRRIAPGALIVAETGPDETVPAVEVLAQRRHGAAKLTIWREGA